MISELAILLTLIGFSFCSSAAEAALLAVSQVRIRTLAAEGHRPAGRLALLLEHRDRLVTGMTILNHAINILAFALLIRLSVVHFEIRGYIIAFLIALPVYLTMLEVLPKSIARRIPVRTLSRLLPLVVVTDRIIGPVLHLGGAFSRWVERVDSGPPSAASNHLRGEIKAVAEELAERRQLGAVEARMIHRIIDSHDVMVDRVMMPVADMTTVAIDMPVSEVLALSEKSDFEHFPVMDTTGVLVGAVDIFDLLLTGENEGPLFPNLRKLPQFRATHTVPEVLYALRRSGSEIASITANDQGVIGIVSATDLLDSLLGSR